MKLDLSNRSTPDIVVLCFTTLVCSVLVLITIGIVIAKIVHPEGDFAKAGEAIYNMLSTIVGALVGFISGRIYGKHEQQNEQQNGQLKEERKKQNGGDR
jgi:hypothetical protein